MASYRCCYTFWFILTIIILNNFTCLCASSSDDNSEIENKILLLLESHQNLSSLPKYYKFTDEEINSHIQEYLEGLKNEDVYLNGTQLIQKYGYDVEEHHVTTSDGYILSLYRIPGKGRPIFLMHGMLCSFLDWITIGPDKGLPYLLAAQGYDVWLGNARGNTYSKQHINLSTTDSDFWDFSWDEVGRFDLPAMIDYVLDNTGEDNLTYIGHSQGTTSFFVLCSEKPEYNDKINLMVALSAVAWMEHLPSPLARIAARYTNTLRFLSEVIGFNELLPGNAFMRALTLLLCGNSVLASLVCENVAFIFVGFDYSQIDFRQAPVFFNHFPSGASVKQIEHYGQLINSGYFRNFDYGTEQNLIKYNSSFPPSYPVDKITAPLAIFYSLGDWFSSPIDVETLRGKLPNVVDYYQVPLLTFNHVDYIQAKDVKTLVYDRVLKLISDY